MYGGGGMYCILGNDLCKFIIINENLRIGCMLYKDRVCDPHIMCGQGSWLGRAENTKKKSNINLNQIGSNGTHKKKKLL